MTTLRFLLILLLVLNALALAAVRGWLGSTAPRGEPERLAKQLDPERIRLGADSAEPPPQALAAPEMPAAPGAPEAPALPTSDAAAAAPADAGPTTAERTESLPGGPAEAAPAEPPEIVPTEPDGATAEPGADAPPPRGAPSAPPAPDTPTRPTLTQAQPPTLPPTAPAPTPVALDCFAWEGLSATAAAQLAQRLDEAGFAARRNRVDTPNSWWVRVPPQPSREQAERRVQELRQLGVRDTYIVPDSGPTQFAISLGVFKTENRARQLLGQLQAQGVRNAGVEPRMSTTYRVETRLPADQRRSVESAQQGLAARRAACARPD